MGQTVSGTVSIGNGSGNNATFNVVVKRTKLTASITCNAPQDSTGSYLVAAGSTGTCTVFLNMPCPGNGCSVPLASSDVTQIIVPGSMTILGGALTGTFIVTALP